VLAALSGLVGRAAMTLLGHSETGWGGTANGLGAGQAGRDDDSICQCLVNETGERGARRGRIDFCRSFRCHLDLFRSSILLIGELDSVCALQYC